MGFFPRPHEAVQEKKDEAIQEAKAIADQEMDKVPLGEDDRFIPNLRAFADESIATSPQYNM